MSGISYKVYRQQEQLTSEMQFQIVSLFRESYYNYHYIDEICAEDRVRFVAFDQGNVVGYATYQTYGQYAYFSNLVVKSQYRGYGIGKQIEKMRFQHAYECQLHVYVSCICDDTYSQQLKVSLGLTPCCIKYGYRDSVSSPGHIGSALIFTSERQQVQSPSAFSVRINDQLKRMTVILTRAEQLQAIQMSEYSKYYIEILVGQQLYDQCYANDELKYNGIDLHLPTGQWHYIFQVKNSKYVQGLHFRPKFITQPIDFFQKLSM